MNPIQLKGVTREEQSRLKAERIKVAAKLYAEARNAPVQRPQMEIYAEIASKMGVGSFTAMQYVQTAYRRKTDYKIVPTHVRVGPILNDEQYLTPVEAAKVLGISPSTLHNWLKMEIGPRSVVMNLDGRDNLLFRAADISKWKAEMSPRRDSRGQLHYYDKDGNPQRTNGEIKPLKPGDISAIGGALLDAERTVRMGRKNVPVGKAMKTLGAQEEVAPVSVPEQNERAITETKALKKRVIKKIKRTKRTVAKDVAKQEEKIMKKIEREMARERTESKSQVKRIAIQSGVKFDDSVIDDDGKVRTIRGAARYLGVTESYFTAAIYGRVPGYGEKSSTCHIKHQIQGGSMVFDPADLQAWRVNVYKEPSPRRRAGVIKGWETRKAANKAKVAEGNPKMTRRTRRSPRKLSNFTKQDCLQDMRDLMGSIKYGSLTRTRWMRLSKTGRRYERFFKGRNAFHHFMVEALRDKRKYTPRKEKEHVPSMRVDVDKLMGRQGHIPQGNIEIGKPMGTLPDDDPRPTGGEDEAVHRVVQRGSFAKPLSMAQIMARQLVKDAQRARVEKAKPWWKLW